MLPKPRDLVRTPTGRTALVVEILGDGRRELKYVDGDRSTVALSPSLLKVQISAKPRPWRDRLLAVNRPPGWT